MNLCRKLNEMSRQRSAVKVKVRNPLGTKIAIKLATHPRPAETTLLRRENVRKKHADNLVLIAAGARHRRDRFGHRLGADLLLLHEEGCSNVINVDVFICER